MNWKRAMMGAAVAMSMVALLAFGLTQDPRAIKSPLPGQPAPPFTLVAMDGGENVSLSELRGTIVVVNFWASWCLACRDEHTALSEVATRYGDQGVRFFGMLYDDNPQNARRWIEEMGGQSYPTLLDPGMRTAIDFGLYGVPETFYIDHEGNVADKTIGPVTADSLMRKLDRLLARRQAGS
jgi:cytochrome c biogenesis protein CcmG/thiol:disulfide interchange protein DsbE